MVISEKVAITLVEIRNSEEEVDGVMCILSLVSENQNGFYQNLKYMNIEYWDILLV